MKIEDLTPASLDERLSRVDTAPILLDLWASWCAPCRAQAPVLARLAEIAGSVLQVAKLDVEAFPDVLERFQVRGIPTLLFFKGGELASRRTGVQTLGQLQQWLAGEGVSFGVAVSEPQEELPLGGAFYSDPELRQFLLGRLLRAASEGHVVFSRFPYWVEGKGTVSASFVHSDKAEIFERVSGLPASLGACLELAGITQGSQIEQVFALLPAGADARRIAPRLVLEWLGDTEWNWTDLVGADADSLRLQWLDACSRQLGADQPDAQAWASIHGLAEKLESKEPLKVVQLHFSKLIKRLTPLPASSDAAAWFQSLLLFGTYLVITRTYRQEGWTNEDFAVEVIQHEWFVAHCPPGQERTSEQMDAFMAQFQAAHADMLAAHEPKRNRVRANHGAVLAPWTARVFEHLLDALRHEV